MASLGGRVRAGLRSGHGRRLLKFGSVSVVSTVITQLLFVLTYDVAGLPSAVACNVIATGCSAVPAYWLNRTWTWGKRGKSDPWREIVPFWAISFLGLVLSTLAVGLAAHNADHVSASHFIRRAFVQMANLATYALIWVGRYVIFNRFLFGERTQPSEEEAITATGCTATTPGLCTAIAPARPVTSDVEPIAAAAEATGGSR